MDRRLAAAVVTVTGIVLALTTALATSDDRPTATIDELERAPTSRVALAPSTAPPTTTTTMATTTSAPPTTTATTTTAPPPVRADGAILLVWISGGLPDGFADDVVALPDVASHTVVLGDMVGLVETRDRDGTVVDRAPAGWTIPLDVLAIDPSSYASFQTAPDRAVLASLQPGDAILTRSSALLRRIDVGATVVLAGGEVTIAGIVADEAGAGAELLVHRDDAGRIGVDDERFVLLTDRNRSSVLDGVRARTPAGSYLSLRSSAEVRWLRHGDRVEPQVLVKRAFGEFAYRDRGGGRDVEIESRWTSANIVTESVPILGSITCHRAVVPAVRAAMTALADAGRADVVDPARYAGCWNPRRVGAGTALSRHSWGIALDLNIGSNPRGTFDSQDPALVEAMETRGFSWGGRWEYPDPGHYEFTARPDG